MRPHRLRWVLWFGAVALVSVLVFGIGPRDSEAAAPPFRLIILHVNDTHGHLDAGSMSLKLAGVKTYVKVGGYPQLAAMINKERANPLLEKRTNGFLLLHAGDVFQGTSYFNKYEGMADAELMNAMGFDAMVLGNHEFDRGPEVLGRFIGAAQFPILSANVDASAEPALKGRFAPYAIVDMPMPVGVIGLTTPDTAFISSPGQTVRFGDPFESARNAVRELTEKRVGIIIVLSHLGVQQDVALAKAVKGIDLIVGGHSHTLIGNYGETGLRSDGDYPIVVTGPDGGKVPVVQAWKWAQVAGVIEAEFTGKGQLDEWKGRPVLMLSDSFKRKNDQGKKVAVDDAVHRAILDDIGTNPAVEVVAADPDTSSKLSEYRKGIEALEKQIIAKVAEDLFHVRIPGMVHEASGETPEGGSQVAPVVAEAMLWKLRSLGPEVHLFLTNAGGTRTDLPAGDLSVGQVMRLLPFRNTIYTIRLTGAEIKTALETGVSAKGTGAFPYLAGARYRVDKSRPAGDRVTSIELKPAGGEWEPIDPAASYTVGVNSFMAGGGDGYKVLAEAQGKRYDTGFVQADAFMEYAGQAGTLRKPAGTSVSVAK